MSKVHGIMAIYDVDGVHVNYDRARALIISGLSFYRSGIQFNCPSMNTFGESERR